MVITGATSEAAHAAAKASTPSLRPRFLVFHWRFSSFFSSGLVEAAGEMSCGTRPFATTKGSFGSISDGDDNDGDGAVVSSRNFDGASVSRPSPPLPPPGLMVVDVGLTASVFILCGTAVSPSRSPLAPK
jgi:hypothetical protein